MKCIMQIISIPHSFNRRWSSSKRYSVSKICLHTANPKSLSLTKNLTWNLNYWFEWFILMSLIKPVFTCLKSTMETSEQCANLFKVNNKDTRMTSMTWFLCLYCWLLNGFHTLFWCIPDFEQVNSGWELFFLNWYNIFMNYIII